MFCVLYMGPLSKSMVFHTFRRHLQGEMCPWAVPLKRRKLDCLRPSDAFFSVNKKMADKYGMQCWTNAETFDRDMPIKFLPIKFDKLRLKLEAAKRCGYDKAITFEFPHFLSPQSVYGAAGNLYNRYKEYFNIK